MRPRDKLPFDTYAQSYNALHKSSIRASGEEPAYFAEYKVLYMATKLGVAANTQPLSILDFGCGIGNSLPYLSRNFPAAKLHGVDVSSESIELARMNNSGVTFDILMDSRIPAQDHSFDVVMAACVYHHIPLAERLAWTKEIRRVLKSGGSFFIFEHNPLNPLTQHVVKNCAFDNDAILLSRRETLTLLTDAGMKPSSSDYIVFFPKLLSFLRPLESRIGWLPLGAQYVIHSRI
jgi:SAM-dependent methyltransferase